MLRRKPLIFLMVVVATVVLFAATQVMAQAADCSLNTSVTSDGAGGKWTLTAVPGPDEADVKTFPYPVDVGGETWYRYDYDLNEFVDHMYLAIPNRCEDPIDIKTGIIWGGVEYAEPGVGAGGWGVGVFSVRMLFIPTNVNRVSYVADRDVLGPASAFFSHGRKNIPGENSIAAVGYQVEDVLTTNFEYDDLITICVKKELDNKMAIVNMWYSCFAPDPDPVIGETCPEDISVWTSVPYMGIGDYYLGGINLNKLTPGTLNIRNKQDVFDLCPRVEETASFMDFLAPSVAHAARTPICYTSGGRRYCF